MRKPLSNADLGFGNGRVTTPEDDFKMKKWAPGCLGVYRGMNNYL